VTLNPASCSVVIPVYNGAETLSPLVERLTKVMTAVFPDYEILLVNDGSPDASWQVIQTLAAQDPAHIIGLNLMRNAGQHNALLCGVRAAAKELVITMDDDLQHPPEEIPNLVEALKSDVDVVYAIPKRMPHSA
jgi:undecaprenyl-phosphate 4-deoxy-4-formamido-L-arabinose transferase